VVFASGFLKEIATLAQGGLAMTLDSKIQTQICLSNCKRKYFTTKNRPRQGKTSETNNFPLSIKN